MLQPLFRTSASQLTCFLRKVLSQFSDGQVGNLSKQHYSITAFSPLTIMYNSGFRARSIDFDPRTCVVTETFTKISTQIL